jgi:hypothetical protein
LLPFFRLFPVHFSLHIFAVSLLCETSETMPFSLPGETKLSLWFKFLLMKRKRGRALVGLMYEGAISQTR